MKKPQHSNVKEDREETHVTALSRLLHTTVLPPLLPAFLLSKLTKNSGVGARRRLECA